MTIIPQEIKAYVKEALEDQYSVKCVALTGSSQNSDGYASNITFATATVTDEESVESAIDVTVKSSRKNLIETNRGMFRREANIYKTILPQFTTFQIQNNINDVFDSVPKCYKTISNETFEVIVMENLKKSGYALYDRKKPLNINHLKLVLREYGKLHAISFAFRSKCRSDFEKLAIDFDEIMINFFIDSFTNSMRECVERAYNIIKVEVDDTKLHETWYKVLEKGPNVAMIEILKSVEPQSAILHGDCWNNNFLYKYQGSNVPTKVALLDWQLSRVHSPVLDLSYFIYSTSSAEELLHFDELLATYYASFSTFLSCLGCDSEKLFSFSTLRSHWKKYSLFGVLMLSTFLHVTLCETEEVPDFNQCKDATDFSEKLMNIRIANEAEYRKRITAVLSHYCKYINNS